MTDIARTNIPIQRGPARRDKVEEDDTLSTMQKSMEGELEKKRIEWENEVKQMQQEFFNLQASPRQHALEAPINRYSPDGQLQLVDSQVALKEDQPRHFRHTFDLHDFNADDISVRVENRKLYVDGEMEADDGHGRQTTKSFSRQVDVPSCVDVDKLTSYFSRDGSLTVEAPIIEQPPPAITATRHVDPPDYYAIQEARGYNNNDDDNYQEHTLSPSWPVLNKFTTNDHPIRESSYIRKTSPIRSTMRTLSPSTRRTVYAPSRTTHIARSSPSNSLFSQFNSPAIVTVNETKKLKLNIDIGHEYDPEDVIVKLDVDGRQLSIDASHDQLVAGRTTSKEFSRLFDLPDRIEQSTLRASLDVHGRLYVGASLKSNDDHLQALNSVLHDLPANGRPVRVII